jgi:hypothetical protein
MYKFIKTAILLLILSAAAFIYNACSDNTITQIFSNEVSAKQRMDSANAQATRKYGVNTKLVMIFGKNVKANGKTDISTLTAATSPDSLGAWLYIFRVPGDTANLRVYTPNPLPGSSDCIELTQFFNVSTVLTLIQDTTARNIVSGALTLLTNANISITTSTSNLIDSPDALSLANTTNPVIKFDQNFNPSASSVNGSTFFSTGTNQTINIMLIPAVGTLHLPDFIQNLTGFPNDLWIVNYNKTNTVNVQENLILGTVVQSNQVMVIPTVVSSKVINLSKFAQ